MSIFAAAFRSSHVVGAGSGAVLIRRIRHAAFAGAAACARSCGHAFFMFRFLAGGRAGTDVSLVGCAGRGLALSGRNERRAEERRNDKSRDCKFGSHRECLRRLQDRANHGQAIQFRRVTNNKFYFRKLLVIACRHPLLSKNRSRSEHRICANRFHWSVKVRHAIDVEQKHNRGIDNVRGPDQGPSMQKVRRKDDVADHRA
jgi:hypothetical protein